MNSSGLLVIIDFDISELVYFVVMETLFSKQEKQQSNNK